MAALLSPLIPLLIWASDAEVIGVSRPLGAELIAHLFPRGPVSSDSDRYHEISLRPHTALVPPALKQKWAMRLLLFEA